MYSIILDAWHMFNIIPVFASGNAKAASLNRKSLTKICRQLEIQYPASSPLAITVGALTKERRLADFSKQGAFDGDLDTMKPDFVAPGADILSTLNNPNGFIPKKGTSMAAPHVAGVIALMLSASHDITDLGFDEIKSYLAKSASQELDLPEQQCWNYNKRGSYPYNAYGNGLVNAYRAVFMVLKNSNAVQPVKAQRSAELGEMTERLSDLLTTPRLEKR